jgi:hypothetical protein
MAGVRWVQRMLMVTAVPRKCKMTEVRGKNFKEGYIRGERSFKDGYQRWEDFKEGYQGWENLKEGYQG